MLATGYALHKRGMFRAPEIGGWQVYVCGPGLTEELCKLPDDTLDITAAAKIVKDISILLPFDLNCFVFPSLFSQLKLDLTRRLHFLAWHFHRLVSHPHHPVRPHPFPARRFPGRCWRAQTRIWGIYPMSSCLQRMGNSQSSRSFDARHLPSIQYDICRSTFVQEQGIYGSDAQVYDRCYF